MLPAINRDLKLCDLARKQHALLLIKAKGLETSLAAERCRTNAQTKLLLNEKRKRRTSHLLRSAAEVALLVIIVLI